MLPVANLDYELKALGIDGVAGSGTARFRGRRPGFPGPTNISGIATNARFGRSFDYGSLREPPLRMTDATAPPAKPTCTANGGNAPTVIPSGVEG